MLSRQILVMDKSGVQGPVRQSNLASDSSVTEPSQSEFEFSLAEFSGSLSAMASKSRRELSPPCLGRKLSVAAFAFGQEVWHSMALSFWR